MATSKKASAPAKSAVENQENRTEEVRHVINRYSAYSFGVGFVPIPVIDMIGLAALQLNMIKDLHSIHAPESKFKDEAGKSAISALFGTIAPQSIASGTIGSAVKGVPVIGGIIGMATFPAFAAASTRALGLIFSKHFADGGGVVDFNPKNYVEEYKAAFKKAKNNKE